MGGVIYLIWYSKLNKIALRIKVHYNKKIYLSNSYHRFYFIKKKGTDVDPSLYYYWENIEKYVEDFASVAYVSDSVLWAAAWRQSRFDAPRSRLTISSVYRLVPG